MAERAIQPIFVVGSARNGTTWLCNSLIAHPEVAAAQHPAHWGFHESNLLKNQRAFGPFDSLDHLLRFTELYSGCDHFRLVEGDRAWLESRRPHDFIEAFFLLMDRYAERSGKSFWLTKLDPVFLLHPKELAAFIDRVVGRYGDFRAVAIRRRLPAVLQSYLNMEGRATQRRTAAGRHIAFLVFETIRYAVHYREVSRLIRGSGVPLIRYEQLAADPVAVLHRVCARLGLGAVDAPLENRYRANSSTAYRPAFRRLTVIDRFIARAIVAPVARLLFPLARAILTQRERARGNRPPLYFKLQKLERLPDAFRAELEANDEAGLIRVLFGD